MATLAKTDSAELTPEAVLARATAARGDIFPEWKILAYASPRTYDLVTRTGGYFHHYEGQTAADQQLSGPMRELIATPALCAKVDLRHAPNHVRRLYRMGVTNRVIMSRRQVLEAISAVLPMTGIVSAQVGLRAMRLADAAANRRTKPATRKARRKR